jgi:hypothetical protein
MENDRYGVSVMEFDLPKKEVRMMNDTSSKIPKNHFVKIMVKMNYGKYGENDLWKIW